MLAQQRRARIVNMVREAGAVKVVDLVAELDVSDMTVRRDLDALARDGLVRKVHGGATSPSFGSTDEPGFDAKAMLEPLEKAAIARKAAAMVVPGQAVGISAGTTTWALAHELRVVPGITVVTNSIRVAQVFYDAGATDQTVVLTGGVRTISDALVGPVTLTSLAALNLDMIFLGVHGMDVRRGFTTPNLMEAETNRAFVQAARQLVVVADHTKWGVVGISTFATLSQADTLITDDGIGPEGMGELRDHVQSLVIAGAAVHRPA
jgi:DeoR/GlpR family transcriptional regulator of sugar metabolism